VYLDTAAALDECSFGGCTLCLPSKVRGATLHKIKQLQSRQYCETTPVCEKKRVDRMYSQPPCAATPAGNCSKSYKMYVEAKVFGLGAASYITSFRSELKFLPLKDTKGDYCGCCCVYTSTGTLRRAMRRGTGPEWLKVYSLVDLFVGCVLYTCETYLQYLF